jgi:hypothetical protein
LPSQDRVRLHQQDRVSPSWNVAGEQHEQAWLTAPEVGPFDATRSDDQLLPEQGVLREQFGGG